MSNDILDNPTTEMFVEPSLDYLKSREQRYFNNGLPATSRAINECGQDKSNSFSALNFMTMSLLSVQVKHYVGGKFKSLKEN